MRSRTLPPPLAAAFAFLDRSARRDDRLSSGRGERLTIAPYGAFDALRGVEQGSRGVSPGSPSRLQDRLKAPALNDVQQNERWASRALFVAFELRNIPHSHMKVVRKHGLANVFPVAQRPHLFPC